jgi:hypothetical protein
MKKLVSILLSSLFIVVAVTLSVLIINNLTLKDNQNLITGNAIKLEEKPGCLSEAGYTWDNELEACTRIWELDNEDKKAAKIALEEINSDENTNNPEPTNIIEVNNIKCDGCYEIQLLTNNQKREIQLIDWEMQ